MSSHSHCQWYTVFYFQMRMSGDILLLSEMFQTGCFISHSHIVYIPFSQNHTTCFCTIAWFPLLLFSSIFIFQCMYIYSRRTFQCVLQLSCDVSSFLTIDNLFSFLIGWSICSLSLSSCSVSSRFGSHPYQPFFHLYSPLSVLEPLA